MSQPPRVLFNFEPEQLPPQEENVNISIEDEDESTDCDVAESICERLPDVARPEIVQDDIFDFDDNIAVMPDSVKKDIDADFMEQGTNLDEQHELQRSVVEDTKAKCAKPKKTPKLNKNGKPRKPMSKEHLEKLAKAREKAAIGRKAAKERRDKERAFKSEENALLKKKKQKDFEKLKAEVSDEPKPAPAPAPAPPPAPKGLTQEDLLESQYRAILAYDTLRKQQKAEKKKLQAEERAKRELMAKIMPQQSGYGAKDLNGRLINKWDSCF